MNSSIPPGPNAVSPYPRQAFESEKRRFVVPQNARHVGRLGFPAIELILSWGFESTSTEAGLNGRRLRRGHAIS